MNYARIVLAAFAALVVFLIYGFLVHGMLIAKDYIAYPAGVYRSSQETRDLMPVVLIGLYLAMMVVALVHASSCKGGRGVMEGARLGLLFGIFVVGAFVAPNYATLHISGKLALELAVSAPIEWTLVGIVIGLIYKPAHATSG